MTVIFPTETCAKCGYYLDDDLKCYECEICNGENMKDTITLTTDTTFHRHYDDVNNPKHYNRGGLECIEAIEAMTEKMSGDIAPHAANVLKYLWRCEYKNGVQDIDKAIWYLNRLRDRWVQRDEVEESGTGSKEFS
tara:strand:+ start:41 stop:448 length:408 start_codon:yes stop_codon:yes gene_type:complete